MAERKLKECEQNLMNVHAAGYRVVGRIVKDGNGNEVEIIQPKKGYPFFFAKLKNGETVMTKLHRLLAYQMFGQQMFKPGIVVRHLNDKKNDLRRINIRLGTEKQNRADRRRNQKNKTKRKPKNNLKKVS